MSALQSNPTRLALICEQFLEVGWLAAAVLVPLFFNIYSNRVFEPDKLTLLRFIALLMLVAWAIKMLDAPSRRSLRDLLRAFVEATPLAIPVLIYVGLYVLTTIASVSVPASIWGSYHRLQGLVSSLSYIVVFFMVVHYLRNRAQLERLIFVILVTSLPICLYALIQHQGMDPVPWGGDVTRRSTSTMGNAIFLGAYLIMVIPLTAMRSLDTLRWLRRSLGGSWSKPLTLLILYLGLLGLQTVALLFTQSRGPWMGFLAGMVFLVVILPLRQGRRWLAGAAVTAALAAFAFVLLINIQTSPLAPLRHASIYLDRLGTILDLESGTNKVRLLIWFGDDKGKGALGMITADPVRTVIGYGPESMFVAYNPFYPPDLGHYEARNAVPDRSHNDLLDHLTNMGVLGLASYLLVVGTFFGIGLRFLWRSRNISAQWVAIALMAAVVSYMVETFFGIGIAATRTSFWLYAGVVAVLPSLVWEEAPATAPARAAPARRSARRRRRSQLQRPAPVVRQTPWSRDYWHYPFLIFVIITIAMIPQLISRATAQQVQQNPPFMVWLAFLWILAGMLLAIPWVKRAGPLPQRFMRTSRAWLYAVFLVLTVFAAHGLLSVITADIYFKIGQEYDRAQRFEGAVPAYMLATTTNGSQDVYFSHLGGAFLRLAERAQDSVMTPTLTLNSLDDLYSVHFRQQRAYTRGDLLNAARLCLEEARRLNPLNPDNPTNLGRLYAFWAQVIPNAEMRQQYFSQSHAVYKEAISLRPNAAHLYSEEAWVYYLEGKLTEAENELQYALWLDDQYPQTYIHLGEVLRAQNRDDDAIAIYLKGGRSLSAREMWEDVVGLYGRAAMLNPRLVEARLGLAGALLGQGKLQEALSEGQAAAALGPQNADAHGLLAQVYRGLNQPGEALKEARLALELAPEERKADFAILIRELEKGPP